jgi:RNA polymerase sigma-70 factor (ECF subfamily)
MAPAPGLRADLKVHRAQGIAIRFPGRLLCVGLRDMDQFENNLLTRLRYEGLQQDWERFVDLYGPLLEHWARRLTPPNEAADLVQDVMLRVMQHLPSFAGNNDRSFLAWLRAVMLNRWRDLGRRALARPCIYDHTACAVVAQEDEALGEVATREARDFLIRRALQIMQNDFEPTTWRACWESVAADRPAADVAAELGVSVEVVYAATYRVIRRLRHELAGAWE